MFHVLQHLLRVLDCVMAIEERKLRVFIRAVKCSSLKEASDMLNMSVSTISRILTSLEKEVGLALFDRSGYRLKLTDVGLAYYRQAQEVVASMTELFRFKERRKFYAKKRLQIATFPRQSECLMVPSIQKLLNVLPQFQISLDVHISRDFWQSRYLHPFDIGFGNFKKTPTDDLNVLPLGVTPLVVCVPNGNFLIHKEVISAKDLLNEKFILLSDDSLVGSTVGRLLPFISSNQISAICSNTHSALAMVSLGMGIHITDALGAMSSSLKNARCIPLAPQTQVVISAFWPKKSFITEDIIQICCNTVKETMKEKGLKVMN